MSKNQPFSMEFLTPEEAKKVDAALLSSRDKFVTRLAIYALRSLQQITLETGKPIEAIAPQEIAGWIQKDEAMQQQIEIDTSFASFFSNLVVSSLKPLQQAAAEAGSAMADLTVDEVVAWFERDAKGRVNNTTR